MLSFKSFIDAIHDAVISANDSLMDKNTGLLDKYFDEQDGEGGPLTPKAVAVEYPYQTKDGLAFKEVQIPLITLVPLTLSEIKEAKVVTDLELSIVEGELQISFADGGASDKKKLFGKKSQSTFGRLEITIHPQESSEGLRSLVQGYEKALKAQIPH